MQDQCPQALVLRVYCYAARVNAMHFIELALPLTA